MELMLPPTDPTSSEALLKHWLVVLAATLPAVAAFYTAATVQSAVNYYRGRGAEWKGRVNLRTS